VQCRLDRARKIQHDFEVGVLFVSGRLKFRADHLPGGGVKDFRPCAWLSPDFLPVNSAKSGPNGNINTTGLQVEGGVVEFRKS